MSWQTVKLQQAAYRARFMLLLCKLPNGAQLMKLNPYSVLLTTGALMIATVVFAQTGPTVSLFKAIVASAADVPATDEARHPDTRVASLDREPTGGSRALVD